MANSHDATVDAIFNAFADPTRRALLARLARRPGLTVGQLSSDLSLRPQTITKHMDVLANAGLISREREGRQRRVYPINDALAPALQWLDAQQRFWNRSLTELALVMEDEAASDG
jgi:DNA-binding transcriptional ArsR family regulator